MLLQQFQTRRGAGLFVALQVGQAVALACLLALLGLPVPASHLSIQLSLGLPAEAGLGPLPLLHDLLGALDVVGLFLKPPRVPELVSVDLHPQFSGLDVLLERRRRPRLGSPQPLAVAEDAIEQYAGSRSSGHGGKPARGR
jgi:hypothetical protein